MQASVLRSRNIAAAASAAAARGDNGLLLPEKSAQKWGRQELVGSYASNSV
jgi:hypothetical protein